MQNLVTRYVVPDALKSHKGITVLWNVKNYLLNDSVPPQKT